MKNSSKKPGGNVFPFPHTDKAGKPVTAGARPGHFRFTFAAPEDPGRILYDIEIPIGAGPAEVQRRINRALAASRN